MLRPPRPCLHELMTWYHSRSSASDELENLVSSIVPRPRAGSHLLASKISCIAASYLSSRLLRCTWKAHASAALHARSKFISCRHGRETWDRSQQKVISIRILKSVHRYLLSILRRQQVRSSFNPPAGRTRRSPWFEPLAVPNRRETNTAAAQGLAENIAQAVRATHVHPCSPFASTTTT